MISKAIGLVLFIVLSPILLITSLIIFFDNGSPVLFKQKRVGLDNVIFFVYKFRTMEKDTLDIPTHLINNDQKIFISCGRFLRKFSIDELPQLINIIKGEMKFIGPRPALFNQDDLISLRTKSGIHKLYPGITGWAQVNGRDNLTIEQKVKFESFYLKNQSFALDSKILLMTIFQIIIPKGVSN